MCGRCAFSLFSLFWVFYAITVLPFIRQSQGSTHSSFDHCQLGDGLHPENLSDRKFFRPQLRLYDPCTCTNVSSSKILAHYAENEHFPPLIPRSLLFAAPCDIVIRHGGRRRLDQRSNFTLPGVVKSINIHHLPHPLSELSPCSIVPLHCTTPGSIKFDLGPKTLPRPCQITISQGAVKRRDHGIGSGKCSFSV